MGWTDDFTTDHFSNGDYTVAAGSPVTVNPHALTVGFTGLIWVDERPTQVQVAPFEMELDVLAGPAVTIVATGAITPDLANGFYAGYVAAVGGFFVVAADIADPGEQLTVIVPGDYPSGDFTIKVTFDEAGVLTMKINDAVTAAGTAAPGLLAALAARTLGALGYTEAGADNELVLTRWSYGGGGPTPPPPEPSVPSVISTGLATAGVVRV